jgi:hypothetical protein
MCVRSRTAARPAIYGLIQPRIILNLLAERIAAPSAADTLVASAIGARWARAVVAPGAIRRGASRYGVRGVAGFDSGSPVLPTMTTEITAGSVALAFADVL